MTEKNMLKNQMFNHFVLSMAKSFSITPPEFLLGIWLEINIAENIKIVKHEILAPSRRIITGAGSLIHRIQITSYPLIDRSSR